MKIIPSHGIWEYLPAFLTKEHSLGKRTQQVIWAAVACICVAGFFYPRVIAFFEWCVHPSTTYYGRKIQLPVCWNEDQVLSAMPRWERPPLDAFSNFDDEVSIGITLHRKSDQENVDFNQYPQLRALTDLGMTCGSVKYGHLKGEPDGLMTFGCLSRDHKTTFRYEGAPSGMKAGISIIEQMQ